MKLTNGSQLLLLAGIITNAATAKKHKTKDSTNVPEIHEISLLDSGETDQATAKADLFEELNQIQKSEKEVIKVGPEVEIGLMAELAGKVQFRDEKLSKLASELEPLFITLPKNSWGTLDHSVVRYALHRLLVQRYGWYIQGLEPDGVARNDTSQDRLKRWVPDFLQEVLERRIGGTGYTLPDVVALAATFERLVHDEASSRFEGIFKMLSIGMSEEMNSRAEIDDVVDLYLTAYLRGGNLSANGPEQALLRLSIFRHKYQGWKAVKEWVNELMENTSTMEIPADFKQFVKVGEVIGENFASFNDLECRDLKRALLDIEDKRPGRVNISQFYKMGLHSHWKFTEKVDYLKALGALDDSDPLNPAVILSNYIMSRPNCLDASHFYSICCRNECDDLLASIENDIQGPIATPERLIELVSRLASDTVTAPRQLSPSLISRLHQVASNHGGRVPLHGRLFAQWMHHAFPRECPFPHEAGTISPQTADEWMRANGQESASASEEEMVCHVNGDCGPASLPNERLGDSSELPWTDNEELLVELPPQAPQRSSPSVAPITATLYRFNQCLRSLALMSAAAGLVIASKLLLEKPGDDPDVKRSKRVAASLERSLVFLILPVFVIMIDCCFGAYSSNDLLLCGLCLGLAALVVSKRSTVGSFVQRSDCAGLRDDAAGTLFSGNLV